jgi:hypothetical protein
MRLWHGAGMGRRADLIAGAVGLASAVVADRAAARLFPEQRERIHSLGLLGAAAIYPAAHDWRDHAGGSTYELAGLAGFGAVGLHGWRRGPSAARVVAAGWAAHMLFDARFGHGPTTRLPAWYPALCAGYDLAIAGFLLTAATGPGR